MNTLKRYTTPIILTGTAILALAFYNYSKKSQQAIQEKEANIEVLRTSLTETQEEYNDALNENTVLVFDNKTLKEKIVVLQKQVKNLRWKVKKQGESIDKYKLEIERLTAELKLKVDRLAVLDASDQTKIEAITTLAAEKEHLEASVANLSKMLDEEIAIQQETKLELIASKLREEKIAALKDVIFNTEVNFISITPSKKENGRKFRKVKRSGKKWKFTNISFEMAHESTAVFEGRTFELQIITISTGKPVPYIESNPMYPESDFNTNGIKFEYTGGPMTLVHSNFEIKAGQNYRAEISLVEDGQNYPLLHGDQAFIVNKKTLKN